MTDKQVTPSEAIYSFVEWLNARFDQVTISQHNDPTSVLNLVKRFCELNDWPIPQKDWADRIKTPDLQD